MFPKSSRPFAAASLSALTPLVGDKRTRADIAKPTLLTLAATDERREILFSVLAASSFVDGQNFTVVQGLADERLDRLGGLAAELMPPR